MNANTKRRTGLLLLAAIAGVLLVGLLANAALAQPPLPGSPARGGCPSGGMMGGWGSGMMGGWGYSGYGSGPTAGITGTLPYGSGPCLGGGMMGMMGGHGGLWAWPGPNAQRLTGDQIAEIVSQYVTNTYRNADLQVVEIMEFANNFYAQVQEQSTGLNAFELLSDPYTGAVWPEYGPNMMWNTKYGHMGGMGGMGMMRQGYRGYGQSGQGFGPVTAEMPVQPEQAVQIAQQFLEAQGTGLVAEAQPDTFYGYYTIHTLDEDGHLQGMLSVNGYTGQVWYHTWHGAFVAMRELAE